MGIRDVSDCYIQHCNVHPGINLFTHIGKGFSGGDLHSLLQAESCKCKTRWTFRTVLVTKKTPKTKKPTQIQRKIIRNQSCFVYFLRIRSLSLLFKNSCRFKESCPIQTEAIAGTRKQLFIWSIILLCPSQEFQHCMIWRIVDSSKYSPKDFY